MQVTKIETFIDFDSELIISLVLITLFPIHIISPYPNPYFYIK